jgi:amino acid adenylation domain-containing protein
VNVENHSNRRDLVFLVCPKGELLDVTCEYDAELFESATITRQLGHYQKLLEGIVANPDQGISQLPILTEAERHRILVEWNDTARDYPKNECIHELFEAQVERSPDAIAVVFADQQLTYQELNQRANQLAHCLQRLGVGPETLVGICVERSLEMVVGLLGILKAGGAYVPLDPEYPKERLAFMFEDAQIPVLLTQQKLIENLPGHSARAVCLDRDWEEISRDSKENPRGEATAENLAYVIYTSGSTGKPKGVESPHRAIARLLFGVDYAQLDAGQTFLHLAPTSFDASTFEIWGALAHGAKCVLYPGAVPSVKELGDLLHKHKVSTLWLTASLFDVVIDEAPEALSGVRQLLIGGEALSVPHVQRALSRLPNTTIINGYGPTESTTFSCCYPIPPQPDRFDRCIPIGRPIGNTRDYILDEYLNPVPIGIPGEIYIGGDGLARGYLNRPELTAEKFIPNPFSDEPGSRLYKTGDLGRYLPDGNIEFLDRIDDQIKIRGFRIEPGEIESVLSQQPGVRETVVLAREDDLGDPSAPLGTGRRLVAYVVANHDPGPHSNELRSFLRRKLPEYMIPSAFVFLDSLPLTPNGKVDRKALPVPDQSRPELGAIFVRPRNPVEEMLAEIWAEVLRVERIGIHDNFFDLGGHSLLATQVVSRMRGALQLEIPLRALFETPTVAGLAERIGEIHQKEQGVQTLPILPVSRDKDLPLSFAQQRLWFLDQLEPGSTVYNVPGAVRMRGPLDVAALEQSLNEIVRRHEALRTTFSMLEGEPVQVISSSLRVSLPVLDITDCRETERGEQARQLAREEARRPFDLTQGPLVRAALLRLGEDDHVLLLTMHHIVSDGWSMGVLYQELSVLYEAFSKGNPSPLTDLPIQYADFGAWQREWLQGEVLESQLSYWKEQLGDVVPLQLPSDRPRPAVQSFRGATQSIELSRELTGALKALSRKEGATLFMTLLAAFQTLLHRYSGQDDIVVGSPIAIRNRTEIEGLIGFFVNTLVLRTDLSGNPPFRELLARVREVALGAYSHQDIPFEKLVEELQAERNLSRTPLFQVFFNMLNQGVYKLDLLGLTTEDFSTSEAESKFDLTLYAGEQKEEVCLNLVYNADLFTDARMKCFLQQYRRLLEQIVSASEKAIRSYSLLTPESRVLLPDPSTVLPELPQPLVTSLFASWAKQTPEHPAVSQGERVWTYGELAERADTLARLLTASGLRPGDVVAVHGVRSFGVIASVIGTLLSGGVLLPVDYNLPSERKQLMLREVGAKRLLHVGDHCSRETWLEGDFVPEILFVDPANACAVNAGMDVDLTSIMVPEPSIHDPAYVFFTSGTTGIPKGVLGCHKGLSHFLKWQRDTFAIGPTDRVAQLTSLSFDVVLRDIFLPLISGGTLCLPETVDGLGPGDVIAWLEEERISVLHTSPTLAHSWLAAGAEGASLSAMRYVFFAGEPLTEALVRRWRATFANSEEIVNLYGPTEATLAKCFYRVPAETPYGVQPIGSPLPETQALVLRENHQLCGINEPGQIVLRTPFRSLGYINAPEENQKRFIKNPFRDDAQDLLYFTGDAGRYRPDGTLEILARLDDQVKIRGVRVEPAEVAATLARYPAVESSFVIAVKNEQDEICLLAYVVPAKQQKTNSTQLRSYLVERLPAAMVPAFFVFLNSLPLTPSGKVDRKALPVPDQARPELEAIFVRPRNPVEEMLAGIWAKVLKVEQVGIHDNFFDLGGHSLLATQVVARIRQSLDAEVPLRAMFEAPTIEEMALVIAANQAKAASQGELERMLREVEGMSEEKAQTLLVEEGKRSSRGG